VSTLNQPICTENLKFSLYYNLPFQTIILANRKKSEYYNIAASGTTSTGITNTINKHSEYFSVLNNSICSSLIYKNY